MARKPMRSFWEYVKNPRLFWQETRETASADDAPAPDRDHLTALVTVLYTSRPDYEDLQQLRKAGRRVIPLLIEALQSPKFLFHKYGGNGFDGSPMESALDVLEPFAEPPTALLEPALRHPDEYFRSRALYHLARCGHDDAISVLKSGLVSPSEACRTYALMGLEFLKRTGRGSERFRRELFAAALPLLRDDAYGPAEIAPRVLLVLDRERAGTVLLGADVLGPDNRNIGKALQALKDAETPVPGARLRALLAAIRDKAGDYPFDYAYADALILLARAEGAAAADAIADARVWGNEHVRTAAAEAIGVAAGVRDAYAVVMGLFERLGTAGLSARQRNYLTLRWLDMEVRNGGFAQYFFNSSGDLAGRAAAAAEAVGAAEAANVIRRAVALFGSHGPDPDRDTRMSQLSVIERAALAELDSQYYACPDLGEFLSLYVARHPDEFRDPGPPE